MSDFQEASTGDASLAVAPAVAPKDGAKPHIAPVELWSDFDLHPGEVKVWQAGVCRLWLQAVGDTWRIGIERELKPETHLPEAAERIPEPVETIDWAFSEQPGHFALNPVTPDRAVVIRPRVPVMLPAGQEARFFALIPSWIQVQSQRGEVTRELTELPARILSDTWFGDNFSGELAYSARLGAERSYDQLRVNAHQLVCPVHIRNESDQPLSLEKICLRLRHVGIWAGESHLWCSPAEVTYRGRELLSEVSYPQRPPRTDEASEPVLLTPPREVPEKHLLRATFSFLERGHF